MTSRLLFLPTSLLLLLLLLPAISSNPTTPLPSHALAPPPLPTSPAQDPPSSSRSQSLEEIILSAEDLLTRKTHLPTALRRFRLASILGHEGAAATLGTLLLAGDQYPRNLPAAVKSLKRAAASGQPDALAVMGMLHASGITDRWGVEKSLAKALVFWNIAAGTGNVYANAALGYRHWYGLGVAQDCRRAAAFYERAAHGIATDPRFWPTAHNFEYGDPPLASSLTTVGRTRLDEGMFAPGNVGAGAPNADGNEEELFYYYQHLADGGDVDSNTMLGSLLLTGGLGVDADHARAREYLHRGVELGGGEAHGILGHLELKRGNWTGAMYHFRYSAAKMEKIGHYALGMVNLHGLAGIERNLNKAAMHFQLAAEDGHAEASFQLGMMNWKGEGVPEGNLEKAIKHFEDSAKRGNIQSKYNLGAILMRRNAPVFERDCDKAVGLFKEVAEGGEWNTLFDLASGMFSNNDWFGALYRHLQAAHAGIEVGQHNAAMMLEMLREGDIPELAHWSRERMIAEMHELYAMSGRQNRPESFIRSADVAFVERADYVTAMRAYSASADLDDPEGLFAVGLMYAHGQGVKVDRNRALDLLEIVGTKGEAQSIAAGLATLGLKVYWWARDMREWWSSVDESTPRNAAREEKAHVVGTLDDEESNSDKARLESASASTVRRRSSLGDDIALVGGLLVILLAVLFVRSKRIARLSSGGS
eukprot:GFKZ01011779.1.p1 GENE.GFKZ01011779.1~~GFKZ01011779.1.p1  ORF type:complete len:705 (-),score=100.24 GFKZ01011779.1:331-2445(-)